MIRCGSRELSIEGEEVTELGHHLQAPLYLQSIILKALDEKYYLHLLLQHVTGAKSFADMRTVDGEVCCSVRQACSRRVLLADDAKLRRVLRESFASEFVLLSQGFATNLAYCEP